jgi:uncharacterized Fe-S cluster protein YjdI
MMLLLFLETKNVYPCKALLENLIQVFNPKNRPGLHMDGATTERIKKQVEAGPSGALFYESTTK